MESNNQIDCPCCNCKYNDLIDTCDYLEPEYYPEILWDKTFINRKLRICNVCGFSYSTPFLNNESIKNFYNIGFAKKRWAQFVEIINDPYNRRIELLFKIILTLSFQTNNFYDEFTIVDFGGSSGEALLHFRTLIPKANCIAVESVDSIYSKMLESNNIKCAEFVDIPDNSVDIIYTNHTLEHINACDIKETIETFYKKLKLNGLLFIEVPHEDFRPYSKINNTNQGPHISHFTKDSLEKLIQKKFTIKYSQLKGPKHVFFDGKKPKNNIKLSKFRILRNYLNKIYIIKDILKAVRNIIKIIKYFVFSHTIKKGSFIINIPNKYYEHIFTTNKGSVIRLVAEKNI